MRGDCQLCRQPILSSDKIAYAESGWSIPRSAGGVNGLYLRKRLSGRAHAACVLARSPRAGQGEGRKAATRPMPNVREALVQLERLRARLMLLKAPSELRIADRIRELLGGGE